MAGGYLRQRFSHHETAKDSPDMDADPSNVSSLVRGAEMRIAETRAVNRALRKAYGIGICSIEEIGSVPNAVEKFPPQNANGNGHGTGPKVRDRLCQIIRQ